MLWGQDQLLVPKCVGTQSMHICASASGIYWVLQKPVWDIGAITRDVFMSKPAYRKGEVL